MPSLKVGYRPEALYSDQGDVRFEGELGGRGISVHSVEAGGSSTPGKGTLSVGGLLANAYYDFHTQTSFTPYVGAGIGVMGARFSKNPGLGVARKSSRGADLVGQIMVGVSYVPEALPNTDWSIGYDYLRMGSPTFDTATGHLKLDDVSVHSLQLGFKYYF